MIVIGCVVIKALTVEHEDKYAAVTPECSQIKSNSTCSIDTHTHAHTHTLTITHLHGGFEGKSFHALNEQECFPPLFFLKHSL